MKLLSNEDIENSIIQVVVGVVTGTTAGVIVLAWLTFKLDGIVSWSLFGVFVLGVMLLAVLGIVGCKYICAIRRLR